MYAGQIKREIEMEVQNASKNNETLEPSNYKITSQSFVESPRAVEDFPYDQ